MLPQVSTGPADMCAIHISVLSTWSQWSATSETGLTKLQLLDSCGQLISSSEVELLVLGQAEPATRDKLMAGSGRTTDPADMWSGVW